VEPSLKIAEKASLLYFLCSLVCAFYSRRTSPKNVMALFSKPSKLQPNAMN
jgi:hypothetical protein